MLRLAAAIGILLAFAAPAASAQQAARPWEAASVASEAALDDAQTKGILALKLRAARLEQLLAEAPAAYAAGEKGVDGVRYVFTDGNVDALGALVGAAAAQDRGAPAGSIVAVNNPYLTIAFLLGSYYVETHAFADALRVLDAGLAAPPSMMAALTGAGDTRPMLLLERGIALGQLKRYADAVASYEQVIDIPDLPPELMARGLRGRGVALIDLNRLDEAEADLKLSLQFDPASRIALGELEYIAELRRGARPVTPGITSVQPKDKPE